MDPDIKQIVRCMIRSNPNDFIFNDSEDPGLTEEDYEKINEIPAGVSDIGLLTHCSPEFANSLKTIIDTHSGESTQDIINKIIGEVKLDPYPINPNNHEFATVSEKDIIRYRLGKILEDKFDFK